MIIIRRLGFSVYENTFSLWRKIKTVNFFRFHLHDFFLQKKLCDKKIILLIGEGLSGFMQKKYIQLVKDNQVSYDLMAFEGS